MRLIRGTQGSRLPLVRGCVATIGNYDGMHLGHRMVIDALNAAAWGVNLPSLVILFEPQPNEYFGFATNQRLTSLREKLSLLEQWGVDIILLLRFNHSLSLLKAEEFVKAILIDRLHIAHLIIGDDFALGHEKKGDFAALSHIAEVHNFSLTRLESFKLDSIRISSSLIKLKIAVTNDVTQIAKFLGRDYAIIGRVIHGKQFGRILGFPTANINLGSRRLPFGGVYLVKVTGLTNELYGIANLGVRPTFSFGTSQSLEVHLLDFNGNIYGKILKIEFLNKIRDEKKFASPEELQRQISSDLVTARSFLISLV